VGRLEVAVAEVVIADEPQAVGADGDRGVQADEAGAVEGCERRRDAGEVDAVGDLEGAVGDVVVADEWPPSTPTVVEVYWPTSPAPSRVVSENPGRSIVAARCTYVPCVTTPLSPSARSHCEACWARAAPDRWDRSSAAPWRCSAHDPGGVDAVDRVGLRQRVGHIAEDVTRQCGGRQQCRREDEEDCAERALSAG